MYSACFCFAISDSLKTVSYLFVQRTDIHSKKILHRDIKAMNVFLDANDHIKIGDLGVAKVLNCPCCFFSLFLSFYYFFVRIRLGVGYFYAAVLSDSHILTKCMHVRISVLSFGFVCVSVVAGVGSSQLYAHGLLARRIIVAGFEKQV